MSKKNGCKKAFLNGKKLVWLNDMHIYRGELSVYLTFKVRHI